MKTKLGIIFDSIAICFILFIIEYFWLYKFIKNAFFVFFILILLNILTFIAIFKFSIKKHNLEKITFQDQKLAKKCFLSMTFQSQNSLKIYLEKLLFATSLDENIYENAQSFFYISIKTGCDEKDFHRAYDFISSKNNSKPLYFICSKTTPEFLNF